jgi:GNAT superfamily N-acetyltransferase
VHERTRAIQGSKDAHEPERTDARIAHERMSTIAHPPARPQRGRPPSQVRVRAFRRWRTPLYVEGIDLTRDAVFVVTDTNLAIIGAAHLAREDGQVQLGMSVLPQSRGQGIGGALLVRCAARARNWGVRVMFMNCLVENAAMMHLARKQGLKIAVSGADADAFVRLPRADLTSLAAEAVAEHLGLFDHAQKSYWVALQARLLQ